MTGARGIRARSSRLRSPAAWATLRSGALGVGSQGLTMLAALLPALVGQVDVLVGLVPLIAVAALVVPFVTLAVPMRMPVATPDAAEAMRRAAIRVALATGLVGLALAGVAAAGGAAWAGAVAGVSVLVLGQSAYVVAQASFTTAGDYARLMRLRVGYASAVLVATVGCAALHVGPAVFAVGNGVAYALAALLLGAGRGGPFRGFSRSGTDPSAVRVLAEARAGAPLAAAMSLSASASLLGALAVPAMGAFAPTWAVVTRVANGFETLGGHVVGPAVEVAFARARRRGDVPGMRRVALATAAAAAALAAVFVGLTLAVLAVVDTSAGRGAASLSLALLFYGALVVLAPLSRLWGMVGSARGRLAWDAGRAATAALVVLTLTGPALVAGLAVVAVGSLAVYLAGLSRAVGSHGKRSPEVVDAVHPGVGTIHPASPCAARKEPGRVSTAGHVWNWRSPHGGAALGVPQRSPGRERSS
ncbi:hypothetical protein Bcav_0956 [Beutenbergia cavernae DSM 12333]|uniref:Polysaccharide biosynthesis protein n=1 Tax=Beutenbergia cavernae (strain ATCC BAA-8 / DSM 12333 / CCUG 43141 / JCM 11478 / NBRC 16432 / NCIMB 13614 / HKI 0122) TaxID=471853 RepID=C5C031_BEUC1|nr:hypothetical protein [Beutenbergia cavernae]ACQ79217.1 hypothetical protein Bcav_0956 [Beutenbergia cavernae DSM 12333]